MPQYSLSYDFNGKLNTEQLNKIINTNILFTATLTIITIVDDIINIVFNQDLTTNEQTYLNNIVSNYMYIKEDKTSVVSIEEISPNSDIKGNYKIYCVKFTALANQVTIHTEIFGNNISVLNGQFSITSNMIGDNLRFCIAPYTNVGTIISDINIGDTIINVSPSVFKYIFLGYEITLSDGVNINECGEVIDINTGNNTITINIPTTNSFSANTPTLVKMSVLYADMEIGVAGYMVFGANKIGSALIPKNTPLVFYYTNTSPSVDKRIIMYIEALY